MKQALARILLVTGDALVWFFALAGFLWSVGAIWNLDYLPVWLARLLAIAWLGSGLWMIRGAAGRNRNSGGDRRGGWWKRPRTVLLAMLVPVYLLTLLIRPANDRRWAVDQMRLPVVTIRDDRVEIENFRDFRYESPERFEPRYKTFSFDLRQLQSVWLIVQRFSRFNGMAHTLVSFGLDTPQGRQYFSISVEIRRELEEQYSPVRGLYRQYELMYVIGSEQDLVGVRTNVRENDRVWLYRANASPGQVQRLFRQFASRTEKLRVNPEFYHTFLNNCTNNIVAHASSLTPEPLDPWSLQIILPGYSAGFALERGLIGNPGQTLEQLQSESRIDEIARQAGITADFSRVIRSRIENQDFPAAGAAPGVAGRDRAGRD